MILPTCLFVYPLVLFFPTYCNYFSQSLLESMADNRERKSEGAVDWRRGEASVHMYTGTAMLCVSAGRSTQSGFFSRDFVFSDIFPDWAISGCV